jgi:hypothetical protein
LEAAAANRLANACTWTTARILARALNCVNGPSGEPCGTCDACVEIAEGRDMDVLEIDAENFHMYLFLFIFLLCHRRACGCISLPCPRAI